MHITTSAQKSIENSKVVKQPTLIFMRILGVIFLISALINVIRFFYVFFSSYPYDLVDTYNFARLLGSFVKEFQFVLFSFFIGLGLFLKKSWGRSLFFVLLPFYIIFTGIDFFRGLNIEVGNIKAVVISLLFGLLIYSIPTIYLLSRNVREYFSCDKTTDWDNRRISKHIDNLINKCIPIDESNNGIRVVIMIVMSFIGFLVFQRLAGDFAIYVLLTIAIHELGHVLAMLICKVKLKGALFLPFGAAVFSDDVAKSRNGDVFIYFGGIILGLCASVMSYIIFSINGNPIFHQFALINLLINLVNLLPIRPLDGGKIISFIINDSKLIYFVPIIIFELGAIIVIAFVFKMYIFLLLCFVALAQISKFRQARYVDNYSLLPEEYKGLSDNVMSNFIENYLSKFKINNMKKARQMLKDILVRKYCLALTKKGKLITLSIYLYLFIAYGVILALIVSKSPLG